jgi:hypothetical protein
LGFAHLFAEKLRFSGLMIDQSRGYAAGGGVASELFMQSHGEAELHRKYSGGASDANGKNSLVATWNFPVS